MVSAKYSARFQLAGRRWWLRGYLAGRPHQEAPPIHSMVGPPQGLPRRTPERILGTNIVRALLVRQWRQWRRLTALKWSTKSDNGHCQVLQLCRCSTLAVESSGLNWMIKLSWTAMGCYRMVFSVMCFRRSVLLRGKALEGKGLQLVSCCQAAKMRMTGSTSCYRRRTCGLLFFFLQCRTSTRHGRSTTGNCKDCFENLPGIETQTKNNTHTTKQTQKHPKQQHPHRSHATARQNNQGDL